MNNKATEGTGMDLETIRALCQINTEFYERNAASFSQTRTAPWEGWRKCMAACDFDGSDEASSDQPAIIQTTSQAISTHQPGDQVPFKPTARSVLDIACGNLRFETFLSSTYPQIDWAFFAVDNCEPLVASGQEEIAKKVHFTCEDIVGNLIEALPAAEPANIPALATATPFDLAVSFGFMHHIPSFRLRLQFLREALSQVKPGGYLIVSFWQFLNDAAKRSKIEKTHAEALAQLDLNPSTLEPNDYLLGWKNEPGNYRYCHHFPNEEIDQLIAALAPHATVVESFSADGKPGNLNRYLVLRRK